MIKLKDIILEQNQNQAPKESPANIRLMELLGKYKSVVEGFINKLNFYVQDTQMFCKQKNMYIKKATDDFKGVILTMQRGEKKQTETAVIDGLINAVDKKAVDVLINMAKKQRENALAKAKAKNPGVEYKDEFELSQEVYEGLEAFIKSQYGASGQIFITKLDDIISQSGAKRTYICKNQPT